MRKHYFFVHLLMICLVVNTFAQSLGFNGTGSYVNITNNSSLRLQNFTLEAWIKIEGAGATTGTAMTTGEGGFKPSSVIPIIAKGRREKGAAATSVNYFFGYRPSDMKLVADFEDNTTEAHHPVVGNTALPANTWIHVAVTYATSGTWKLYINGSVDKNLSLGKSYIPQSLSNVTAAIASSLNSKAVPEGFFKGRIDEVRIWNLVRSDVDIYDNHKRELTSGTGLVARYGLNEGSGTTASNTISSASNGRLVNGPLWVAGFQEAVVNLLPDSPVDPSPVNESYSDPANTTLCATVSDPDNTRLRVRYYGRKRNKGGKFTIILLPDTQFYTREPQGINGGSNIFFKSQTSWIAANREKKNIVYVGHMGDIVEYGDTYEVEWQRADTAMLIAEDPVLTGLPEGVPYGMCVGNHDQSPAGPTGTTTFYNHYFGTPRFDGRSYYGGHYGDNNDNHYQLFSVGSIDFLVISAEWGAITTTETSVLDWMENLVKAYPSRKVIVMSHWVLNSDVSTFNTQGYYIYHRLKVYPNFILMVGGHDTRNTGEARRSDTYNGNTVHTISQDYQARVNCGNGLLRIYEFDSSNNNLAVKTYSPYTDTYETDENSQFNLNVNLGTNTPPPAPFTLIDELTNQNSGSNACISWPSLESNAEYEWYIEVYDGQSTTTGPVWWFTTDQNSEIVDPSSITKKNHPPPQKTIHLSP
jgi:hypothetical protein